MKNPNNRLNDLLNEQISDHPDRKDVDDWFLYGPKNSEIESLVRDLTLNHGLRLSQVEEGMLRGLRGLKAST